MSTYHSTRGGQEQLQSKQTIRRGLAPDGGLYISDELDALTIDPASVAGLDYKGTAKLVLSGLLSDYSSAQLDSCLDAAYGEQWSDPAITPLVDLGGNDFVLELFRGPTSAFKDVALQLLPGLMALAGDDGERIMVLTATSGDTGKAALAGFADAPGTGITVFYPEGKVSQIQRLQMVTQQGGNLRVCAVRGNFDDTQSAVKSIFADADLARELEKKASTVLSSANSINVGRLAPQVVYYFRAYGSLMERGVIRPGDPVEFCVPTGNFGDVLAGYYAKMMGLPVARLTVASDRNRVLSDFLTTGVYDRNRPFYTTTSPSMDILISSNLERMLYYMADGDTKLIASLMADLESTGRYQVPEAVMARIRGLFSCGWADENQVASAISSCWEDRGYLIDPHTACGYQAMIRQTDRDPAVPRVLLSTASPYKFPRVVCQSLGLKTPDSDFACMDILAESTNTRPPKALRALENAPVRFQDCINTGDMADYVRHAVMQF